MRGADSYNESLFTTARLEDFVPANRPLRPIRNLVDDALARMNTKFSAMYEAEVKGGRPSIAPEKLMQRMLLQVLYSERQFLEQIQYNLLFRWFVGLAIKDPVWNHSIFGKNQASHKSMRRKNGSDDGRRPEDWRAESHSNDTH